MTFRIEPLGDSALLIELGERIDAGINARALALADSLRAARLAGVHDVAPAYASVCLRYEPLAWSDPRGAQTPYERIAAALPALIDGAPEPAAASQAAVEIPVCYGGEFGPDLGDVAARCGRNEASVIERHVAAEYRVAMLGFAPGFPYLLGLDASLHTPRRANPRTRVPAGSVAIGGAQTGIYPRELPGGWHIVGRTPLRLFDPARDPPALMAPGQRVRFRGIGADEFAALSR